jgi:ketosteroid isomerase-like protein
MSLKFAVILMVLGVGGVVQGQSALQEMVKTEQAFSKMAQDTNPREAFMAFIAEDGLLFRPGAVNGKKWMLEHPVPPSDKKPVLVWQPAFAGMAASEDMGFTTGPWEAKVDVNDAKPGAYGHFMTVWKKQVDGSWKFVVDLGIAHPQQSGGPLTLWQPSDTSKSTFKPVDVATSRQSLLDRDQKYSAATLKDGLAKAFLAYASPKVRLYRANNLPYIGRDASSEALAKTTAQIKWQPIAADTSSAGDLGYTHGTYEADGKTGSYVRIWKKQNGTWQIIMDVTNPH